MAGAQRCPCCGSSADGDVCSVCWAPAEPPGAQRSEALATLIAAVAVAGVLAAIARSA